MELRVSGNCKVAAALTVLVACGNVPSAVSAPGPDPAIADRLLDVIVIMRDQVADTPPMRGGMEARKAVVAATQAPVLAQAQAMGAARIRSFRMINAFAASMSRAQMESLSANRSVKAIVMDRVVHVTPHAPRVLGGGFGIASRAVQKVPADTEGLCNTLEPEALQLTNTAFADPTIAQAQQVRDGNGRRVTGEGVKVAYLADSVDPNILGFVRPDGSRVFFDYQDFSGDPADGRGICILTDPR
jgi:hypothetical protein